MKEEIGYSPPDAGSEDLILKYAIENGIIDMSSIQDEIAMKNRKDMLSMHPCKIWQGKDGKYYTYIPGDNGKRRLIKRNTREEVENLVVDYWSTKTENPTVKEVFEEWNDRRLRLGQIANSTYDRNIRIFERHFSSFGNLTIKQITPQQISDFLEEEIADKKLTAKGFSNLKNITKGFLRRAQTRGLVQFSVNQMMLDLDLSDSCFRQNEKIDEDDVFTEEEFSQLVSYLKNHIDIWNLGILLILVSGLRVGELVALKWSDFLNDGSYNHFKVSRTETYYEENGKAVYLVRDRPKTKAGIRNVTIPDECVWIIKELRKINPFGEYVFMRNGKRMTANTIRSRLYRVCDKIGLNRKSPHKGRKTYASILLDHGVDNSFIIAQLGHTDISCTESFYHKDRKSDATKSAIVNGISEFDLFAKQDTF